MIRNLVKRIWQKFLELNLFKKHSSNEHTLEKELLSTRIYLNALIVCVSIITIIVALIVRPVEKIEYKPSHEKFSKLIRKYPNTLHCPCSKSSTNYFKFVTTKVNFHQVCSSDFIQQAWIDKLFTNEKITSKSIDDARNTLSFFWQTIAGLCLTSNKSWNAVIANFEATSLTTPTAIAEQVIRIHAESALQNQIDLSNATSTRNLLALQRITRGDQIVSALQTNFYLRYPPTHLGPQNYLKMTARTFGNCTCSNIEGCPRSATFNDSYGHLVNVPRMIVDCLVVDGTLASTLECYYNQSCISILHGQLSMNIKPLSNTSNKNFSMYSTVKSIFNKLMIDETITEIRFDKYFSECNCRFCSYSYRRRFDIFFVFTAVAGSIGMLPFIVRHIASFVATKILRRKNRILSIENVSTIASTEQNRTIAAGVYTIVVEQNQVITVSNPSLDTYEQLYNDYPTTLYCPCSQISIPNKVFLNVTFVLHQVCSSDLVSLEWLHYLRSFDPTHLSPESDTLFSQDFRKIGASYFQLLATFCSLAEMNIADAQHIFLNTEFINDRVPSLPHFIQQTKAMMTSFIDTTKYDFLQTFNWMRLIFLTSYLYNGLNTNVGISINEHSQVITNFRKYDIVSIIQDGFMIGHDTCNCETKPATCSAIPSLYINTSDLNNNNEYLLFKILHLGCSPLSGFLESKTAWWYDITYMEHIQATYSMVIHTQRSPNIEPLNANISTLFDDPKTEDLLGSSSTGVRSRNFPRNIYDKIKNFNIYEIESTDNTHIRQQQIYTKVYLFFYIVLLSIVLFYTILIERRITETQQLHSIDDYEQLLNLYSDDISCPCTYTSISYDKFITELQVSSFHDACDDKRLYTILTMYMLGGSGGFMTVSGHFTQWINPFVKSLEQLCSLAKHNVENSIDAFLASTLFTNQLMSRDLFDTEMNETLSQFENKTKTAFAHILDLIRSTIQGNALLHINSQAWSLVKVKTNDGSDINFLTVPRTFNNTQENTSCLCSTLQTCRMPRQVNINSDLVTIDGIVIGCHQLETLLLSSLTCFYYLQCINILRALSEGEALTKEQFDGLNTLTTRFSMNDTIEKIAYEMFIESWSTNTSYETYFNSCSPSYCIYTYYQKSDELEILTIFLSAYGSLSIAVYFIVPYLVKLIKKFLICFRITQQQ
ncbi:unnamed protein product [Adineta steineri]|uniref:Uncharacterized protein n=1 Tax=Adineta steineri TaxID=433720 RepID=A0A815Q6T5_9BILA|nr:unnamed protein product [Adineta steineri]CAF3986458.1 unnamed protein product [Adineta steineri]